MFTTFGAQIKPFAAAPVQPQVFETYAEPMHAYCAPLTEVYRICLENGTKSSIVKEAWGFLVNAINARTPTRDISGMSVNLEDEIFVAILGWDSTEVSDLRLLRKVYLLTFADPRKHL